MFLPVPTREVLDERFETESFYSFWRGSLVDCSQSQNVHLLDPTCIFENESLLHSEDGGKSVQDGKDSPSHSAAHYVPGEPPPSYRPQWKTRAKLLLPHVGMVVLSCFYTLLGGMTFYFIEHPNEVNRKEASLQEIEEFTKQFAKQFWQRRSNASEPEWNELMTQELRSFMEVVFRAYSDNFVTFRDIHDNTTTDMWTFPASLFFSVTVITTIGYGHLVPQTTTGKVACVIFALFGIPLILVTVADMGKFLSEYVASIYDRCDNCMQWFWQKISGCMTRLFSRSLHIPEMLLKEAQQSMKKDAGVVTVSDEDFFIFDRAEPKIPVLFVSVCLLSYTAVGAILLRLWEPWTFFESFYYCFITVTTIGFGDIVPQNRAFLLLTLMYIVTGLIITSMCIDLVGSQYIRKVHYFGQHMRQTRYALVQIGDRVVHLGEVIRYMAFLQKRYGLTSEELERLGTVPEEFLLDCLLRGRPLPPRFQSLFSKPFIPRDWPFMRWIDSRRTASYCSEKQLASLDSVEISSGCGTLRSFGASYLEHSQSANAKAFK